MPDYIEAARLETLLMREWLALPSMRPTVTDSVWVADIPCGPSVEGRERLKRVQASYGFAHVTTGNASPGAKGNVCGVYVRRSAYEKAANPLRTYLSREA